MSQSYVWPAPQSTPPVGGATAANQVLEIAQLTAINSNTAGLLTDAELRATPVPVSGAVTTDGLTDAELRASAVPVSLTSTTITGSVAVTGPLTDTELRATPVPVSGTVSTGGLTDAELRASAVPVSLTSTTITGSVAVTGPLTDTELRATPVPVSGTVSTGGLTDAELRATAVPVSLTSTTITGSVAVTGPLTDTELRATPVPVSGTVTANAGTGTFAVSAASLPLPTGAATEATLSAFSTKSQAGLVPEAFDEQVITYVGATDRISTVVYKLATVTVATLTMSYDGSDRLDGVVKT